MSTRQDKLIVNLAPTGIIPTRSMTPHVPLTPEEIAADVHKCHPQMVHLHARDGWGKPTHDKEVYARIIVEVKTTTPDIIICVSTSGRLWQDFERRSEVLELEGDVKPDMASLTLSSLNFNKQASINEPSIVRDLARKMLDNGIKPELEVFDTGMLNYVKYLIKKELLKAPYYVNFILGNIACAQVTPLHLGALLSELPTHSIWSVGGVGDFQLKANAMGILFGGGVRVGLEDNIYWYPDRKGLATNTLLVYRIRELAQTLGVEEASIEEARWMIGL